MVVQRPVGVRHRQAVVVRVDVLVQVGVDVHPAVDPELGADCKKREDWVDESADTRLKCAFKSLSFFETNTKWAKETKVCKRWLPIRLAG